MRLTSQSKARLSICFASNWPPLCTSSCISPVKLWRQVSVVRALWSIPMIENLSEKPPGANKVIECRDDETFCEIARCTENRHGCRRRLAVCGIGCGHALLVQSHYCRRTPRPGWTWRLSAIKQRSQWNVSLQNDRSDPGPRRTNRRIPPAGRGICARLRHFTSSPLNHKGKTEKVLLNRI